MIYDLKMHRAAMEDRSEYGDWIDEQRQREMESIVFGDFYDPDTDTSDLFSLSDDTGAWGGALFASDYNADVTLLSRVLAGTSIRAVRTW